MVKEQNAMQNQNVFNLYIFGVAVSVILLSGFIRLNVLCYPSLYVSIIHH